MGKSAPSPPPVPDPVAIANAQTATNVETARTQAALNRVDQYTPYGDISYTQLGGADIAAQLEAERQSYLTGGGTDSGWTTAGGASGRGGRGRMGSSDEAGLSPMQIARKRLEGADPLRDRWRSDVTLSADQQRILDLQEQGRISYGEIGNESMGRVRDIMGTALDFSGLPQVGDNVTDRQRVEDALFARMQPRLDQQREGLDARLRNQGLTPGSEAWGNAWKEYSTSENDLRLGVVGAAGQEQQRLFGMASADRERAMREYLAQRQIPLNESAALLGGAQVQYPQFSNVPGANVAPTDVIGANQIAQNAANQNYQGQMAAYNSQNQGISSILGAATKLGAAWITSDERMKENKRVVGKTDNDLDIYLFNYKGDKTPRMGVMAQDVEKVNPKAVATDPGSGMKMVNLEAAVMASRARGKGKGVSAHV